jgi:hypothetical protein
LFKNGQIFYKIFGQNGQGGVLTIRAWLRINFGITSLANEEEPLS